MRHRLPVQDVSLRFGPAGRQAADNPLDLRLRYIKVAPAGSSGAGILLGVGPCFAVSSVQQVLTEQFTW